MSNYRRARVPGGTYFFTVVTHGRAPFLTCDVARQSLHEAIDEIHERHPFTLDAIVLLPDHLHAIWTLPRGDADYSTRWRLIKKAFTQRYLAHGGSERSQSTSRILHGERGIWQRRFWEHCCEDEEDLKRCVDYLHLNPVKHRLVDRVSDWPWSSFHRFVERGEYDPTWGGSTELFGDEWRRFE